MHRTLSLAAVLILLIQTPHASAGDGFSESIRVDWEPSGAISVRATSVVREGLEIAIAGRSGSANQRIRLGIATPALAVGPLDVSGAYRELQGSSGGPWSDAWFGPGHIDLDTSLDSSRRGLALRPLPVIELFLWETSSVVFGTRVGLGDRDAFAETLATFTTPAIMRGDARNATPSWFDDRRETLPIGHVIVRLGRTAAGAAIATSVSGSFPSAVLPGLSLRASAKLPLPWRWKLAAGASMATPDYRLQDGSHPGSPAHWGASLRRDARFLDVGFTVSRAYASTDAAYEAIGFTTDALLEPDTEATASIAIRRRDDSRAIASVGARVELDLPPAGSLAWRVRISSRVARPDWPVELSPSVALASEPGFSARARAVYSVQSPRILRLDSRSTLAFIVVGEYERSPDASDFDLSFSIRTTIERVEREAAITRE